ncbi:methyl-accepting chemotaxis protein [Vibrio sp. JC009]|uniref:methyl-accepting chemotaxis protein n=1 Tax=Vibrio sp. JC009 TaxID=2912314 RepID=UPI0023AFEDD4|nr:methyl-accepting chemotaxis protein [Vibrio sp. JC009]WED21006.1 methyl-accepting chemotaxis protein [Vibrio sp. JC009]
MKITLIQRIVIGFMLVTVCAVTLSLSASMSQSNMEEQLELSASTYTHLLDQSLELSSELQSINRLTLLHANERDEERRTYFADQISDAIDLYQAGYDHLFQQTENFPELRSKLQDIDAQISRVILLANQHVLLHDKRLIAQQLAAKELTGFMEVWEYFNSSIEDVIAQAKLGEGKSVAWTMQFVQKESNVLANYLTELLGVTRLDKLNTIDEALTKGFTQVSQKVARVYDKYPAGKESLESYFSELEQQITDKSKLLNQHKLYISSNQRSTEMLAQQASIVADSMELTASMVSTIREKAALALQEARASNANSSLLNRSLLLATIVIALVVTFSMVRAIRQPLSEIKRALGKLAAGDLSYLIQKEFKSEFGEISQSINQLAIKLKNVVEEIKFTDDRVNNVALQGLEQGKSIAEKIETQQIRTQTIATAVTQMEQSVNQAAKNADDSSEAIGSVVSLASGNMQNMQSNVESVTQLQTSLAQASKVIEELSAQSREIDTILMVIQSISEQTNLLALNAAIEAARAGEHGRGFAVVADEVRSLATRTQDSANEISIMIESLQSKSKDAVGIVQTNVEQAGDSVELINVSHDSLAEMVDKLYIIDEMSRSIAQTSIEQDSVTKEVTSNIVQISEVASNIADSTRISTQNSQSLRDLSVTQSELISQFKLA